MATIVVLVLEGLSKRRSEQSCEQPPVEPKFVPDNLSKKCPMCAETTKLEALVCQFCGHSFQADNVQPQVEEANRAFDAQHQPKPHLHGYSESDSSVPVPDLQRRPYIRKEPR